MVPSPGSGHRRGIALVSSLFLAACLSLFVFSVIALTTSPKWGWDSRFDAYSRLLRPDVAAELGLTPGQKTELRRQFFHLGAVPMGMIGAEVGVDRITGQATIEGTFSDDMPAERAGFRVGDRIACVDGETVTQLPLEAVVEKIRGEPGAAVELDLVREPSEERISYRLVRVPVWIRSGRPVWWRLNRARDEVKSILTPEQYERWLAHDDSPAPGGP